CTPVLTAEELNTRREQIRLAPDLSGLLDRLTARAGPVLERMPVVPSKALLSADGGACPDDGARLEFNPWSPTTHRCPRCGKQYTGERHDRAWAHYQHLWVAERAAHLGALAALSERDDAASRANELLQAYRGYLDYPNRDNVLGPSRLFFSTYLESIWIGNYLAAAMLLRDGGMLEEATADVVSTVAEEAANLIGEFDEGLSNRQTWHNAALASIAVWFEDEELASRTIEGASGVVAHLLHGFGEDGMWYEGDNYHLFALRGQLLAMGWARQAGVDLLADERLAERLALALRAPAVTALPDFTFPARKDSRFGVSLAQPMYLELWEIGLARLSRVDGRHDELWSWLQQLYRSPAPEAQTFDSYLHDAGEPAPRSSRRRTDLSWWSLLEMAPSLPTDTKQWSPESAFIEGQGLAVLRRGNRYASLESGVYGGGHGHPDRLNLTLHADGEYWLPDFGTGSYVARDLFWYRSTLAHNAPRLDGVSQPPGDAVCDNFEADGEWAWVRGRYGELARVLVAGPEYLLDVVELAGTDERLLELPWHLSGRVEIETMGRWEPAQLQDEFVGHVERFVPASPGPIVLRAQAGPATLGLYLAFEGELVRATAPGAPGTAEPVAFYLVRGRGKGLRYASVIEPRKTAAVVHGLRTNGAVIEVEHTGGVDVHLATAEGWEIRMKGDTVRLRGSRRIPAPFVPTVVTDRPLAMRGTALQVGAPPPVDGTLNGFETDEPLLLDHEDQYRRSEEPYSGPETFSATAFVNWDEQGLYLAVEVTKPEVLARDPRAQPLRLDNEPDEIHADGIQVYLRHPLSEVVYGWLIALSAEGGELIVRPVAGTTATREMVRGTWRPAEHGYTLTLGIALADWSQVRPAETFAFDLLVNQMLPGRHRRAGQLVWSGGGGWVWLRGDRQDAARFGTLELR
ncbi:MAG TPA: heparinase II/III family protein, partial [Gemmatimonadales bacterium]|nr:heparinase II/III family protein [Gemmatimonadales bacterium]